MTIQYYPGMPLGEFEQMIADHATQKPAARAEPVPQVRPTSLAKLADSRRELAAMAAKLKRTERELDAARARLAAAKQCQHPFDLEGIAFKAGNRKDGSGTVLTVSYTCPGCSEELGTTRKLIRL